MMSGESSRQALVVLGAHRSGTSALGGVLSRLGVDTPAHLMGGDADNPSGYFESSVLTAFHDRVLDSLQGHWSDWNAIDPAWVGSAEGQSAVSELSEILQHEYGDSRLFLVKDPRMCRLCPVWIGALSRLEVTPKVVLPVRPPHEVAASLAGRQRHRVPQSHATLIWLRHVLDAERGSRDLQRIVTRYSDLMSDWSGVVADIGRQLGIDWPTQPEDARQEIDAYLTARPQKPAPAADATHRLITDDWAEQAFAAMNGLVDDRDNDLPLQPLDAIKQQFDSISTTCAPLMARVHFELRRDHIERGNELASLRQTTAVTRDVLAQEQRKVAAQLELSENQTKAFADLVAQLEMRIGPEVDRMASAGEALARESKRAQGSVAKELAEIRSEMVAREALLTKAVDEVAAVGGALDAAVTERDELSLEVDQLRKTVSALDAALAGAQIRLEQSEATVRRTSDLPAEVRRLVAAYRTADESLRERFVELAHLSTRVLRAEERAQKRRDRVQTQRVELRALYAEVAALAAVVRAATEERPGGRRPFKRPLGRRSSDDDTDLPGGDLSLITSSPLFNSGWYLRRNPDVEQAGVNAAGHYLSHGAAEGRDPGPAFSTTGYLSRYPELAEAGVNPLVHYLRSGRSEGRLFTAADVNHEADHATGD